MQVEAPGCALHPRLFPYFVSENVAREVVFIARVAKMARLQREGANVGQIKSFLNKFELKLDNPLDFAA